MFSISTPTVPCMQLFRQHRCVFGFLFQFNRGEIGNIFFYSPLAPLESLLSFGLFMKNYFMLTYICCLFSPSVTCSKFSFISKALNPILYVCRSAFSIELRLKYRWTVRKVWQEETSDLLLCTGLYRRERKKWIPEKGETRWLLGECSTPPEKQAMQSQQQKLTNEYPTACERQRQQSPAKNWVSKTAKKVNAENTSKESGLKSAKAHVSSKKICQMPKLAKCVLCVTTTINFVSGVFFFSPVFVESILIFLSVQENWQSLSFNISNKSK